MAYTKQFERIIPTVEDLFLTHNFDVFTPLADAEHGCDDSLQDDKQMFTNLFTAIHKHESDKVKLEILQQGDNLKLYVDSLVDRIGLSPKDLDAAKFAKNVIIPLIEGLDPTGELRASQIAIPNGPPRVAEYSTGSANGRILSREETQDYKIPGAPDSGITVTRYTAAPTPTAAKPLALRPATA